MRDNKKRTVSLVHMKDEAQLMDLFDGFAQTRHDERGVERVFL